MAKYVLEIDTESPNVVMALIGTCKMYGMAEGIDELQLWEDD